MLNNNVRYVVQRIFQLSDQAVICMFNRLFAKRYTDADRVVRCWETDREFSIWMTIGGGDHYRCQIRLANGFPQIYVFDKGRGCRTLSVRACTLTAYSARRLEKEGLIVFVPLLFCCFAENEEDFYRKREQLKYFIFHDIVWALHDSMKKGDLNVYDVQKLKQLCGHMAWKFLNRVEWMQSLELQELLMEAFQVDVDFLERIHQQELEDIRNKRMEN